MSDNLFHYTDVGAVKAILEKRELWLTDIRFLNDSQELNDGVEYILEALNSYIPDGSVSGDYLERAQEMLTASIAEHIPRYVDVEPTFVCSFSEAGDQLSQWRAYGNYAIEFERDTIEEDLHLFHCIYDESNKKDVAVEMVSDAVYGVAKELQEYGSFGPDSINYTAVLVRTASIFKDASFHEEREVRSAVDLLLPNSDLKFRQRGGMLIPYIIKGFSLKAVKAIYVGPMPDQQLAYTSMKAFVRSLEHKFMDEGGVVEREIEIVQSKIPYRAT